MAPGTSKIPESVDIPTILLDFHGPLCYSSNMLETAKNETKSIDFSAMDRTDLEEYAVRITNKAIALEAENSSYKELLRRNRRDMFGPKSERHVSEGQLSFFNEAEKDSEPDAEEPDKSEALPAPRKKKGKGHKKGLVSGLPKETIEYKLTDKELICPKCGGGLTEMKTVVRTEIEVIPAEYKVVEHRTKAYSCRACDKEGTEGTIVAAQSPGGMFRNSLASPSLAADIIFKKYVLAQPLYRQEQELSRAGLSIGRNTLANWVVKGAELYLMPIRDHMKGKLVASSVIHADETPVEVIREPGREASADSYMWMYRTGRSEGPPVILFDYTPGRGAEYPKAFLGEFTGHVHCDGYAVYTKLAREGGTGSPHIVVVCCWAHARRKFTDIIKGLAKNAAAKGTEAEKAIEYIGRLFRIEEEAKDMPPDVRLEYRAEKAAPIVDGYFSWLKSIRDRCVGSLLTAVNYSLNREDELRAYLTDGRLEISNNLGENTIRPFCVGRRNWLFCDTPNGARASAACYGIIETAKANGVNAFEYLKYIFTVFKDSDIGSLDMEDFMPWSPSLPDACRKGGEPERLAS